jgi:hypothetical protein
MYGSPRDGVSASNGSDRKNPVNFTLTIGGNMSRLRFIVGYGCMLLLLMSVTFSLLLLFGVGSTVACLVSVLVGVVVTLMIEAISHNFPDGSGDVS